MKTLSEKAFNENFEKYLKHKNDKRNKIELNYERIFKNKF